MTTRKIIKEIVKILVIIIIFFSTIPIASKVINKGHDNITMEMAKASFPIVAMSKNGIRYNELHGYAGPMETAYQRDTTTILSKDRETDFEVDTFGRRVLGITAEVRSIDGERLIEKSEVTDYTSENGVIQAKLALKDLLSDQEEYSLALILQVDGNKEIYYYTKIICSDEMYVNEKIDFVLDFHEKLFDKTLAKSITKYLETDSAKNDNSSHNFVNIYSSWKQVTYGELAPVETSEPVVNIKSISPSLATITIDYELCTGDDENHMYYFVRESFRTRYTKERSYLLGYERWMETIPDIHSMCVNDKIVLGITDTNVPFVESTDGSLIAFTAGGQLFTYNTTTNHVARVFSFYDEENYDKRTYYNAHGIRILNVSEDSTVDFAVYGYMNRGRHEGEVGVEIYTYDSALNTIEEILYLPYSKSFQVLQEEVNRLLFKNSNNHLYIGLENQIYCVDLVERTQKINTSLTQEDTLQVSRDNRMVVSISRDENGYERQLTLSNLKNEEATFIKADAGEVIRPLGFMGNDLIYGLAKQNQISSTRLGKDIYPFYKICICDSKGRVQKEYEEPGIYVTDCNVQDNQITLNQVAITEDGRTQALNPEHITVNLGDEETKNKIVAAVIDTYETYVQIQVKEDINAKTLRIVTPKEVVYEGGRSLIIEPETVSRYYVYDANGIAGIYNAEANAVLLAEQKAGEVVDENGNIIWKKVVRQSKNQIMAITEQSVTPEKNSLVICLDAMMAFKGIIRNSEYLLMQNRNVVEVLSENLEEYKVLDLTGCSLDSVLYYVNNENPVLAMLRDGSAVLITGYNEYNVVLMDPQMGILYKKGMNDATALFADNGNQFITYVDR